VRRPGTSVSGAYVILFDAPEADNCATAVRLIETLAFRVHPDFTGTTL